MPVGSQRGSVMGGADKKLRIIACWTILVLVCAASANTFAATFVVTQDTDVAFRAAVTQANQNPGPDRIEFADGISSIAITQGQIEIFDSLEIVGRAGAPVTLSGSGTSRILAVIDNEQFPFLDLVHLIIEGGATTAPGTEIVNDLGNPDCSESTGNGGAICSETIVRLNDVIVRDSQTSGDAADGGGIWAASGVDLAFSSVLNNRLLGDVAYGAGVSTSFGSIFCDYSRIDGNISSSPEAAGGGVAAQEFSATNCVVSNNEAAEGGGVLAPLIELSATTIENNSAQFRGGGIFATSAVISDGDPSQSSLVVVNSTISGNQAEEGGGIFAIAGDQANFRILNSTITDNVAPSVGGVEIVDEFVDFMVNFAQSDRDPGLGVEPGRIGALAKFDRTQGVPDAVFAPEVVSTLISGNQNDGFFNPDLAFTPSSDRETNLIQQSSLIGPEFFVEIELAPLADNGCFETAGADVDSGTGCAQTHRLRAGSTAIDQGLNAFELEFDQRGSGFPRVNGAAIDIGAYEFEALQIEVFSLSASVLRQADPLLVSWSVLPDQDTVSCIGAGLPGTSWDGLAVAPNGELSLNTVDLLPGNYSATLECQRDGEVVFAEAPLEVLAPVEVSLDLVPGTVRLGEPATVSWAALPDDSATTCSAVSVPQIPAWSGPLANSGSIEIDSGQIVPGSYQLTLLCARNVFSAEAVVELVITDDPLEIALDLIASPAIVGDVVEIEWVVTPDDEFSSCSGFGLDGTDWNGPRETSGLFLLDTAVLGAGSFAVGLECSRPGQTESVTVPLLVDPLELSLEVESSALIRGDDLTISWTGTEGLVCSGSGLPGTTWDGTGKPSSGQQIVNTAPLPAGDYQVGLSCERNQLTIERQAAVTVLPLELDLSVNPATLIRGDDLTISWTGAEGLVCSGSGLPGTTWDGAGKPSSGQQIINTAPLPAGDYQVGLSCERNGLTIERQAAATVLPLELAFNVNPATLIRGDDLTISWTGTEGLVCSGSGLPGTTWDGTGKPSSGQQIVNTAQLPAGDYQAGLSCERNGLTIERQAAVTVLPLELAFNVNPATLIRGDDLTISWTGTEGLVCSGSGLPGTTWDGDGKAASGTQLVNTEPLEPDNYLVALSCERRGIVIERTVEVTVLAPPADLALAAVIIDMGIPGSDFVEFSTANSSENPAFDLQFAIAAPAGYEIADVFRSAAQCAIDEESSEVRCDIESIGDWQCATNAATSSCTLAELPAGAASGLVVEFRGQGPQTVSGAVGASNADSRVAEIEIGTGGSP